MSTPTNSPEPTRWSRAQPAYGTLAPDLLGRADRGLARFVGDPDEERENTTGGGET
uniref:Uncharacterized protein n=1 Tax=Streptomyces sp. NBC_00049 TaxID=2903617 RepID=A0AAU2JYR3_9ACTN